MNNRILSADCNKWAFDQLNDLEFDLNKTNLEILHDYHVVIKVEIYLKPS